MKRAAVAVLVLGLVGAAVAHARGLIGWAWLGWALVLASEVYLLLAIGPRREDIKNSEPDRAAWDAAWSAMPHRGLTAAPHIAAAEKLPEELVAGVIPTISLDPEEYADDWARAARTCVVCGAPTDDADTAKRASLYYRIQASDGPGACFGLGVWVHEECFERCVEISEPTPVPW